MSTKEWKEANKDKMREWNREYYHKNKEKALAYKKLPEVKARDKANKAKYRAEHKEEIALRDQTPARRMSTAKSMAKKRGHIWTLTLEQYSEIIKNPCYYCENQLGEPVKKGSGLDRMDCNKGYEIDNAVSCCSFCNGLKSDKLTPEETVVIVQALLNHRKNRHSC